MAPLEDLVGVASWPSHVTNGGFRSADAVLSWALLGGAALGAAWAVAPERPWSCCKRRSEAQGAQGEAKAREDAGDLEAAAAVPASVPGSAVDSAGAAAARRGAAEPPQGPSAIGGFAARAKGQDAKAGRPRKEFMLDNLKLFLTLMVVNTHTSAAFDSKGGPLQMGDYPSLFRVTMFALYDLNQAYYMALFFFLSGYFAPGSLDRKGPRLFLRDRFRRLGLPALAWFFGLGPAMSFGILAAFGLAASNSYQPIEGPPWFVLWLLVFSLGYATVYSATTKGPVRAACPGVAHLLGFGVLAGVLQWLVALYFNHDAHRHFFLFNPRFAQAPFYVLSFTAGVVAKRNKWLDGLKTMSRGRMNLIRACVVVLAVAIVFSSEIHDRLDRWSHSAACDQQAPCLWLQFCVRTRVGWALTQCIFGVAVSTAGIDLFQRHLNVGGGAVHRFFVESMYAVYVIHYPFVQLIAWSYMHFVLELGLGTSLTFTASPGCWLRLSCSRDEFLIEPTSSTRVGEEYLWLGWLYTTTLTIAVVWPVAWGLRRLPGLRDIL